MFGFFDTSKKARRMIETIPVADIQGTCPGPTLLVTAGMDGDEYAGIEAGYEIAEKYKDGKFAGRLIILPIVNTAGFEQRVSINPLDNKFPKYCIPGKARGSATERLMHHIVQDYAREASLWLDLHSGALNEIAIPCLWSDITGNKKVDGMGEKFIETSGVVAAVREQAGPASHALAVYECAYILAESEEAAQHSVWVENAMRQLGMISGTSPLIPTHTFTATRAIYAEKNEMWNPEAYTRKIGAGEMLLWHRMAGQASKGERLGEIAYKEMAR